MLLKQRKTPPKERSNISLAPPACIYGLACCLVPQDRAWILLEMTQEDKMV